MRISVEIRFPEISGMSCDALRELQSMIDTAIRNRGHYLLCMTVRVVSNKGAPAGR